MAGGAFATLALLLLRGGRVLGMQAGSTWRLALAGLQRRYRENVAQIMIFGIAIMLLLIMLLVRTGLIDEWRAQIPENTPNHFVMNVAAAEAPAVQALLKEKAGYEGELFPMIRGRITAVNDTPDTGVADDRSGNSAARKGREAVAGRASAANAISRSPTNCRRTTW